MFVCYHRFYNVVEKYILFTIYYNVYTVVVNYEDKFCGNFTIPGNISGRGFPPKRENPTPHMIT
jgi:hypothetical protein